MTPHPPRPTRTASLFPYTPLFPSAPRAAAAVTVCQHGGNQILARRAAAAGDESRHVRQEFLARPDAARQLAGFAAIERAGELTGPVLQPVAVLFRHAEDPPHHNARPRLGECGDAVHHPLDPTPPQQLPGTEI